MKPIRNFDNEAPIAIDAMGGDRGPGEVIAGIKQAIETGAPPIVVVGDEKVIRHEFYRHRLIESVSLQVVHAPDVIGMEESPSVVVRKKPLASVRVAFELVARGEASSVISAGNTGAMMAAGLFAVGSLTGILRPAIGTLIPKVGDGLPTVLIDSGANIDCSAHQLVQFGYMGSFYARSALGIESPRVGLLSNGSESSKGTDTLRSAAVLLKQCKDINFIGYVEGRDISHDVVDVVVCDGFVGNVVLKAMEGTVELVVESMRSYISKSILAKLGFMLARRQMRRVFQDKLHPSAYGGAPLLGLNCIAIVCHGASDARAIKNAIRVAQQFGEKNLIEALDVSLAALESTESVDFEDGGMWSGARQSIASKPKSNKVSKTTEEQDSNKKKGIENGALS
jgi:glycerol-3-phosphate acyltransferase PlsX